MKGDFTKFSFQPQKHYLGVLHQQGRVSLDSDWNEDVLARLYQLQQETIDVIGSAGVPEPGTAFEILAPEAGRSADDFTIRGGPGPQGHFYVGGMPCALEHSISYLTQQDYPSPPRLAMPGPGQSLTALVYLEAWPRLVTYLEDDSIREVALGGPDTATRLKMIAQVKVAQVSENTTVCPDINGAFLPSSGRLTTLQPPPSQPEDQCSLPDPASYTGRENRLYRVEIHDEGNVLDSSSGGAFRIALSQNAAQGASSVQLAVALTEAQINALQRSDILTLRDNEGNSETVPVTAVSNDGRTLTLGRTLTRAFTLAAGATAMGGVARFKWSRQNASFAVAVEAVAADRRTLTLSSLGRDEATALREGDLVEISNETTELRDGRGHLTYLKANPDPDQFTAVLLDALPSTFPLGALASPPTSPPSSSGTGRLILRRWDGLGFAAAAFDARNTPDMNLGDGVQIQFGGSLLRVGDYWNFTTRATDGSIEPLLNARPANLPRAVAPLAIVRWTAPAASPVASPPSTEVTFERLADCRKVFPPLVNVLAREKGIRVTQIFARNSQNVAAQLANDSTQLVERILGGIDVVCDGELDPVSLSRPTCFATIEFPQTLLDAPNAVFQELRLAANVTAGKNLILWRPAAQTVNFLQRLPLPPVGDRGYLFRLCLKGNFIWSAKGDRYLDGEALGQKSGKTTALRLPSGDQRRGGDFEMWFWINPPQPSTPFTLIASVAATPVLRAEGIAELTGDLVLIGNGGTPTAAGQAVPTFNIQIFLNTPITSPTLVTAPTGAAAADTVLLIDEPRVLNTTRLTATTPVQGVGGGGLNYEGGAAPNVFIATRPNANSILFANVPLDAPGNATRTLRIKNIRVNASVLGAATAGVPAQVIAFVGITGATALPVGSPQQVVGFISPGLNSSARRADGQAGVFTFSRAAVLNQAVLRDVRTTDAVTNILLNFTEPFASSFKVRSVGAGDPSEFRPQEEAAFDNSGTGAVPVRAGDPALPSIGLASSGTRFLARFANIPVGVRVFVTTRDVPSTAVPPTNPNSPPMQAVLVTTEGNGSGTVPPPTGVPVGTGGKTANIPFAEVSIVGGSGFAAWEWVSPDPGSTQVQTVRFGVVLAAPAAPNAQAATATVRLGLAPLSTTNEPSPGAPVPRFIDSAAAVPLFQTTQITLPPITGGGTIVINRGNFVNRILNP